MRQTISSSFPFERDATTGFRALLKRLLHGLSRKHHARRAVREMAMLDDHMLSDIGLDRASIGLAARYGRVRTPGDTAPRRYRDSERALYDRRLFRFL